MARILIGWELGAGRGHLISLLSAAEALKSEGHEPALAVQRFEAFPPELPSGIPIFQGPLWPGLLSGFRPGEWRHVATMIDILARLGADRPRTVKHMLSGWDTILQSFRPDLVIGDFAPALLLAAQGRLPAIATGPGFQVPPFDVEPIPRVGGGDPGYDEDAMLDIIDADLRETARPALDSLAAFFRHDRALIASFPQLDPFGRPDGPHFVPPALGSWCGPAEERGDEVFVYANANLQYGEAFWRGLALSGLKVRAHVPVPDRPLLDMIAGHGITVEPHAIPWPDIARRSRIAVNHGAHGTICALMLAGIPQLALPGDLEKRLHSEAMERQGLGICCDPDVISPEQLAAALQSLAGDEAISNRVRESAPAYGRRMATTFEKSLTSAVSDLLAG